MHFREFVIFFKSIFMKMYIAKIYNCELKFIIIKKIPNIEKSKCIMPAKKMPKKKTKQTVTMPFKINETFHHA